MKRYLKSIFALKLGLFAILSIVQAQSASAQSTLFNIPSTDVVAKKSVYLEMDFLAHLESYDKGGFQGYVPRAVVGLGGKLEAGVNVAFTRSGSPNSVELQPNV